MLSCAWASAESYRGMRSLVQLDSVSSTSGCRALRIWMLLSPLLSSAWAGDESYAGIRSLAQLDTELCTGMWSLAQLDTKPSGAER